MPPLRSSSVSALASVPSSLSPPTTSSTTIATGEEGVTAARCQGWAAAVCVKRAGNGTRPDLHMLKQSL